MFRKLFLLLMGAALLAGCLGRPSAPPAAPPPPQTARAHPDRWLIEAENAFAFDLFEAVHRLSPDENLFLSPVSVALVLSMTYTGAAGATAEAMDRTLHLDGRPPEELNEQAAALQANLATGDGVARTEFANSIWYRKGFAANRDFLKAARTHYAAEVSALDFGSPAAARAINQWVTKSTHGRIEQALTETQPEDLMYLVNTVYFKAPWHRPFDPAQTRSRPFHLPGGSAVDVPMMTQRGYYAYIRTETFQAVELVAGYWYSVLVILPHAGVADDRLYADLRAGWPLDLALREGSVTLPKLTLTYETRLKDPLTALGMGVAFSPEGDFSGLAESRREKLMISDVIHKTFLEMNEEGVEAAAVTMEAMLGASPVPDGPFDLVVDRPYLLAIVTPAEQILFMGAISYPR